MITYRSIFRKSIDVPGCLMSRRVGERDRLPCECVAQPYRARVPDKTPPQIMTGSRYSPKTSLRTPQISPNVP